jgi:hypothetical protein
MKRMTIQQNGGEIRLNFHNHSDKELQDMFLLFHNHNGEMEHYGFPNERAYIRTSEKRLRNAFESILFHRLARKVDARNMEISDETLKSMARKEAEKWWNSFERLQEDIPTIKANDYAFDVGVNEGLSFATV